MDMWEYANFSVGHIFLYAEPEIHPEINQWNYSFSPWSFDASSEQKNYKIRDSGSQSLKERGKSDTLNFIALELEQGMGLYGYEMITEKGKEGWEIYHYERQKTSIEIANIILGIIDTPYFLFKRKMN